MAKLTVYLKISGFIGLLLFASLAGSAQFRLDIQAVDRNVSFINDTLKVQRNFANMVHCRAYIEKLPALLASKGYPYASIDSLHFDSATAYCIIFVGGAIQHLYLDVEAQDAAVFSALGWNRKNKLKIEEIRALQERILDYMENNGYPFASTTLEDIVFRSDSLVARLKIDRGPLYKIDSIRNHGNATLSSGFLQQYLGIKNGSAYKRDRLSLVSSKLRELPYVQEKQPWNLTMLGTGSILNLYLETKRSSEVNVLIGLLPSNQQLANNKMLVTGEATVNLKNSLGGGESIGLNWQQIQVKSPRLNLLFQQPYLFGSAFGMNLSFDLFKKDSSFVNISMLAGASYAMSSRQTGTVFIQRLATNLLTVDTIAIKGSRKLPPEADVSSVNLGVSYEWVTTDYRFNPRKGNEFAITASAGTKAVRKNNVIIKLRDDSEPSFDFNTLYDTFQLKAYQFRVKLKANHFFPLGKGSTLKTGFNGGWFQSPSVFRNELFQIGGYKLLRGFDEESIFSSGYGVATAEYRYLIGQNSFLSAFMDYGLSRNSAVSTRTLNRFLGAGLGMAFETKAGIFNITYAAGKRDNENFNLRQSKIHLGYVNYF